MTKFTKPVSVTLLTYYHWYFPKKGKFLSCTNNRDFNIVIWDLAKMCHHLTWILLDTFIHSLGFNLQGHVMFVICSLNILTLNVSILKNGHSICFKLNTISPCFVAELFHPKHHEVGMTSQKDSGKIWIYISPHEQPPWLVMQPSTVARNPGSPSVPAPEWHH